MLLKLKMSGEDVFMCVICCGLQGWWNCLAQGVDGLLKEMPGVHTERMLMALTFSLVKAVCERTPRLLRGLYNTMTQ